MAQPKSIDSFRQKWLIGFVFLFISIMPKPVKAEIGVALFIYNMGKVTTQVDTIEKYSDAILPYGYEMGGAGGEFYFEASIDALGKLLFLFFWIGQRK